MKIPSLLCTAVVILCMAATACSSQGSSPANSTSKDSAVTESVDQGAAQDKTEADSAVQADTAEGSTSEDNASEVKSGEGFL